MMLALWFMLYKPHKHKLLQFGAINLETRYKVLTPNPGSTVDRSPTLKAKHTKSLERLAQAWATLDLADAKLCQGSQVKAHCHPSVYREVCHSIYHLFIHPSLSVSLSLSLSVCLAASLFIYVSVHLSA